MLEAEREKELNHEGKPTIECPQCGVVYRGGKCRSCGYEPTPKERSKQGVEWHDGELVEITKREPSKLKKTCEQILIESLYRAGLSGRTWRQAWGIGKREAERLDMKYRVPRAFVIAGVEYKSVEWDHPDTHRKVKDLYPELFG